jgi:serine O-acetyltransferase
MSTAAPAVFNASTQHRQHNAAGDPDPAQIGRIWQQVNDAATDIANHEPLLASRMQRLVLTRSTLGDSLAAILASRLACDDMPQPALHALMHEIFSDDQLLLAQAAADMTAVKTRDPACPDYLHVLFNLKGFHALQTHRVAHFLWRSRRNELAYAIASSASLAFGVDIHPAARIGSGVMLDHATGIVIGETAQVDDDVSILQNVTLGGTGKEHGDRHPKIRSGVMLGAGAKVLGNIEVGTMSKVAAGSVVLKNVPAHCTVAGVPAKIVRIHSIDSFPSLEMNQMI